MASIFAPGPYAHAYEMQLNSVSPASAPAGATVQLNGSGFGAAQAGHRVIIRYASGVTRNMAVTSWGNTQIGAIVPSDASAGASTIAILNPTGKKGPVNASQHVPFNVIVTLKPGVVKGIGNPNDSTGLPGIKPPLQLKAVGCPDPAIYDLKPAWPAKNSDGTYSFRLLALTKNVGAVPFESARRQTQITLKEGSRVLLSEPWSSPMAESVVLAPGQGFSAVFLVSHWNPSSEFLADFSAELSYDPDIYIDSNPKNDDCGRGNNRKVLTVGEVRRLLGVTP